MECKLNKSLYGLKQAAYVWNKTVSVVFTRMGFKQCGADQCIYVKRLGSDFIFVCLYVDDMIIAAETSNVISEGKSEMEKNMKTLSLAQTQCIRAVASCFNLASAKDVANPCDASLKQSAEHSPLMGEEKREMTKKPYRSLVGCLFYIAVCTRPDVAYAVCHLSCFLDCAGVQHWKDAIRVLRYLKTACEYEIVNSASSSTSNMIAFIDAEWGSNVDDRRSVSGVLVMMNPSIKVLWH